VSWGVAVKGLQVKEYAEREAVSVAPQTECELGSEREEVISMDQVLPGKRRAPAGKETVPGQKVKEQEQMVKVLPEKVTEPAGKEKEQEQMVKVLPEKVTEPAGKEKEQEQMVKVPAEKERVPENAGAKTDMSDATH